MNLCALTARLKRFWLYPCHQTERTKTSRNHSAHADSVGQRVSTCHNFQRPTKLSVILAISCEAQHNSVPESGRSDLLV